MYRRKSDFRARGDNVHTFLGEARGRGRAGPLYGF